MKKLEKNTYRLLGIGHVPGAGGTCNEQGTDLEMCAWRQLLKAMQVQTPTVTGVGGNQIARQRQAGGTPGVMFKSHRSIHFLT